MLEETRSNPGADRGGQRSREAATTASRGSAAQLSAYRTLATCRILARPSPVSSPWPPSRAHLHVLPPVPSDAIAISPSLPLRSRAANERGRAHRSSCSARTLRGQAYRYPLSTRRDNDSPANRPNRVLSGDARTGHASRDGGGIGGVLPPSSTCLDFSLSPLHSSTGPGGREWMSRAQIPAGAERAKVLK